MQKRDDAGQMSKKREVDIAPVIDWRIMKKIEMMPNW